MNDLLCKILYFRMLWNKLLTYIFFHIYLLSFECIQNNILIFEKTIIIKITINILI